MKNGVHGEKLVALLESPKLPSADKQNVEEAIQKYHEWIDSLEKIKCDNLENITNEMIKLLNEYKRYIDLDLIFDSKDNFLYRQKGQLKLDNTVIEEFLPIYISKCLNAKIKDKSILIGSQSPIFSSLFFESNISDAGIGGGLKIKTKDQDFSICRKLFIKSSYNEDFPEDLTVKVETNLGYITAEIKTNLDKTMFQEASATAHDVKQAVTGAKYFLLCEWLDMKPISSETTDIDKIIILRKAKRIASATRALFADYEGRMLLRDDFIKHIDEHPYDPKMFLLFINLIIKSISLGTLNEEEVLKAGSF